MAEMNAKKVVVVGLSKTGTTTLKEMLQTLGYDVCGPRKHLLKQIRCGNIEKINPTIDEYDAFEDWPWPLTYEYLYNMNPDGFLFILTTRVNVETWFSSIENHGKRASIFKPMTRTYGYYKPYGRRKEFSDVYKSHNDSVRSFFKQKNDVFLDFCLENGDGWKKLCEFLDKPEPSLPVPHRNKTSENKRIVHRMSNVLIGPFYRLYCCLSSIRKK